MMLALNDLKWQAYEGGYRVPYDASVLLRQLFEQGATADLWEEFWSELHHQGDVGPASYAAVPWLVKFVQRSERLDWNPLALIAVIELERPTNPAIPPELAVSYHQAIRELPSILGTHPDQDWDEHVTRSAVACVALARGQRWYAKACFEMDRDTASRWFSEEFGWDLPQH